MLIHVSHMTQLRIIKSYINSHLANQLMTVRMFCTLLIACGKDLEEHSGSLVCHLSIEWINYRVDVNWSVFLTLHLFIEDMIIYL